MTDFLLAERLLEMQGKLQNSRLMYRKCAGAYGSFRPYMSMSDYTTADFLQSSEITTRTLVRFSKSFGKDGEADTGRDNRGFFVKLYTKQGECDFICHNMPMYYINDGYKLPSLYDAFSANKMTNIYDANNFWKFVAENPEAVNMLVWLFSDRGTLRSYRYMEGYSNYTQEWRNSLGKVFYARVKWEPMEGARYISRQEAEFLAGFDPEAAARDLYEAVENSQYPAYELLVQLIPESKKGDYGFDIYDTALRWDEDSIPYMRVGKMLLNKMPEDFMKEIDGAAFSPDNLPKGMGLCNDGISEAMCFVLRDNHRVGR